MAEKFHFDLSAKRPHLSDGELIAALQSAVTILGDAPFSTSKYDLLGEDHPSSATIMRRFGTWKKALALIGITGVREREIPAEDLIANLEKVWKELGYPPGRRQLVLHGEKYSQHGYKRRWGSLRAACEAISAFQSGKISKEQLIAGSAGSSVRKTIPLKDRWTIMKRDSYRCVKCGASPSNDHNVELEIDHVTPVSRNGTNALENLQTLCRRCNQGKKDK